MIAAVLLSALWRQRATDDATLVGFARQIIQTSAVSLPFLVAHVLAFRLRLTAAVTVWLAGFVLYPIIALRLTAAGILEGTLPDTRDFVIAAAFSAAILVAGSKSGYRLRAGNFASLLRHLPFTLDGSVIALLTGWVLATTSLFASTENAVHNQPLMVWFDPGQIARHPIESIGFLCQFAIVAALLYAFYWGSRYLLVRRALARQGWIFFALASLSYWIVATPLLGSAILHLPINLPDWSILPSENRDVFDPLNYGFTLVVLAVAMPIVLASERLLAEQSDAVGRHEQTRAELALLQQQINPHFLFNSLNTLYALCLKDRPSAAQAVVQLSDLLRYTVYEGQRPWVRLDQEIDYLRNYIALQLLRLGDRCKVRLNFPPDTDQLCIPPLLLIILVENAFKHGIEPSARASELEIDLQIDGERMQFVCRNSRDPGLPASAASGFGLANLNRRLELIYGSDFVLRSEADNQWWRAELELELRQC